MDEAQALADRVAVIAGGEIVATGTPDDLGGRGEAPTPSASTLRRGRRATTSRARSAANGAAITAGSGPHDGPDPEPPTSSPAGRSAGLELSRLEVSRPSLEDVYLELTGRGAGRVSGSALVLHQFRFEQKVFWRSPAAVFFTVMFPVIFLLIFSSLFGDDRSRSSDQAAVYYVPGIITLAVVSASLVNVAIRLIEMRESGRLKRCAERPCRRGPSSPGGSATLSSSRC